MQAGVHKASVLCPHLLILVLRYITEEFKTDCPQELLYAGDLVLLADFMKELRNSKY